MLADELVEKLLIAIERYGNLPIFDWDNDKITAVQFSRAETLLYGDCPVYETAYPDRLILKQ